MKRLFNYSVHLKKKIQSLWCWRVFFGLLPRSINASKVVKWLPTELRTIGGYYLWLLTSKHQNRKFVASRWLNISQIHSTRRIYRHHQRVRTSFNAVAMVHFRPLFPRVLRNRTETRVKNFRPRYRRPSPRRQTQLRTNRIKILSDADAPGTLVRSSRVYRVPQ